MTDRVLLATSFPANTDTVYDLIARSPGDDTRSAWAWYILSNGDVILGVAPHGDTYEELINGINDTLKGTAPEYVSEHIADTDDVRVEEPVLETYKVRFRDPHVRTHVEAQTVSAEDGTDAVAKLTTLFPKYSLWGIVSINIVKP